MIVDAHHHFWDPGTAEYPWLTDEPVCLLAATHAQVVGTAGRMLDGLSDGELAAVMGANATRIYGL